jgi:hypothetical protein
MVVATSGTPGVFPVAKLVRLQGNAPKLADFKSKKEFF